MVFLSQRTASDYSYSLSLYKISVICCPGECLTAEHRLLYFAVCPSLPVTVHTAVKTMNLNQRMKKSRSKIKNSDPAGKSATRGKERKTNGAADEFSSLHTGLSIFATPPDTRGTGFASGDREHQDRIRFFGQALETAAQAFCSFFPDGRFKAYNTAFLRLTGYTSVELKLKLWTRDLTPPKWHEQERAVLEELRHTGRSQFYQKEYVRKDGSLIPVEVSLHTVFEKTSKVFYYCSFIRDIAEPKRAEQELQKANENLSGYVQELEEHNRETELFSEMVSLLQACATLEEVKSVIGRLARGLFSAESGALYLFNSAYNMLEPVAAWGEEKNGGQGLPSRECWGFRLGRQYLIDARHPGLLCAHVKPPLQTASLCVPLMAQGETLGLLHLQFNGNWLRLTDESRERQKRHKQQLAVAVAENVALSLSNFKLRDRLYVQSIHDYLTGLYNRRYMAELLEKELHRMARKKQTAGVIIIDIDRFKTFNDTYGHEAGDLVLREFSSFLRKHVREEDFACRYGGDEFVVILPETSRDNARQRAEQLREGVTHLGIRFRGKPIDGITLSLGMAVYPHDGLTVDAILSAADAALYRAKAEGRDRVVTA